MVDYDSDYDYSFTTYDDILEFDPLTGQWKEVDRMIQGREWHAVSVVEYSQVALYCN